MHKHKIFLESDEDESSYSNEEDVFDQKQGADKLHIQKKYDYFFQKHNDVDQEKEDHNAQKQDNFQINKLDEKQNHLEEELSYPLEEQEQNRPEINYPDYELYVEQKNRKEVWKNGSTRRTSTLISPTKYKNIIQFTAEGICFIADYFHKKHGIDIYLLNKFEDLKKAIAHLNNSDKDSTIGFIVWTSDKYRNHAIPIVYQKKTEEIAVFYLDSIGSASGNGRNLQDVIKLLNEKSFQEMKIYSIIHFEDDNDIRQSDEYSCVTDALALLKDVLRIDNIENFLISRNCTTEPETEQDRQIYYFKMPVEWCKTAQREAFVEAMVPEEERNRHCFFKKKSQQHLSLKQFREQHRENATWKISELPKGEKSTKEGTINSYLNKKGLRYKQIVGNEQYKQKNPEDDVKIAERTGLALGLKK